MNYLEIENLFETDLEAILNLCKVAFDRIEALSAELIDRNSHNAETIENMLAEATGWYVFLNPIYKLAEAKKLEKEDMAYLQCKKEMEAEGKKFIADFAKRKASEEVSFYRRIRNILEAYTQSSSTIIGSCQSLLRALKDERKNI